MNNHDSVMMGSSMARSPRSRNAYLPSYLMGDSTTSLQSLKVRQQLNQNQPQTYFNFGPSAKSPKSLTPGEKQDKPRAPPLMTLEESFRDYCLKQNNQDICPPPFIPDNSNAEYFPNSPSPAYRNIDNSRSEEDISELWVTVFGFSPDSVPFILEEFGHLGLVLKHFMSAEGNWIHLLYENKIQARRALSRNGRVYNGNMMVGVVPCTDKKTMDMYNKTRAVQLNEQNETTFPTTAEESFNMNLTPNFKRKLPQRQNSMLSKAAEFIFNW